MTTGSVARTSDEPHRISPFTLIELLVVVAVIAVFGNENTFTFASAMSAAISSVGPRSFHFIPDAAKENATSRMLVGIHFQRPCNVSYEQGLEVGNWAVKHHFRHGHEE